jgi:hypothetical protein
MQLINEFMTIMFIFVNSCFQGVNTTNVNVYLGVHTISDIDSATYEVKSPAVRRRVKKLINVLKNFRYYFLVFQQKKFNDFISSFPKHESYKDKIYRDGYDIAILILDEEVSFTDYIQAACLPDNNILYPSLRSAGAIAGWGRTDGNTPTSTLYVQNVKVYVADDTTDERCLHNENIMCLGFFFNFAF